MQQVQQTPPLLGGALAWSLLDLNPRLPVLYNRARQFGDTETTASTFAEVAIAVVLETINLRRVHAGRPKALFDVVSQQPPLDRSDTDRSRRRIDSSIRVYYQSTGGLQTTIMAHVETKRHGAPAGEVDVLVDQIETACRGQPNVYGITFHGTAIRMWRWEPGRLLTMTGYETEGNWIDFGDRSKAMRCSRRLRSW